MDPHANRMRTAPEQLPPQQYSTGLIAPRCHTDPLPRRSKGRLFPLLRILLPPRSSRNRLIVVDDDSLSSTARRLLLRRPGEGSETHSPLEELASGASYLRSEAGESPSRRMCSRKR